MVIEKAIEEVLGWSPVLRSWAQEEPQVWKEMAFSIVEGCEVSAFFKGIPKERGLLIKALRAWRKLSLVAAAVSEQATQDVTVSFAWLSHSAEQCIQVAFDHAFQSACSRFGADSKVALEVSPWVVLGLGKLGAKELNPCSDVDLIVVYREDGPVPGVPNCTFHTLYSAMAREAAAVLGEPTEDGKCLHVDYDLRPEGRSGALVNSLDALVAYYEQYGSPLDRMAWTRARRVAGDEGLGDAVIRSVSAFVYPRSCVSGALAALAGVLGRIRGTSRTAASRFNLKTSRGGIRDIELVVTAFQLLHGGRQEALRTTSTLEALAALSRLGLLSHEEGKGLASAYKFLRRLEHLVQYRELRRTHELHLEGSVAEAISALLEPPADLDGLKKRLESARLAAVTVADRLFGLEAEGEEEWAKATILDLARDPKEREESAKVLGFYDIEAVMADTDALLRSPSSPAHPRHLGRYPGADKKIIEAALKTIWPDAAIAFLSRLVRSRGSQQIFGLLFGGDLLDKVAALAAKSGLVAEILLDDSRGLLEHALTGFSGGLPERGALLAEVMEREQGPETAGEVLASFYRRHLLSIALCDLAGGATEEQVGAALANLADATIEGALRASFGGELRGLAVLGLGSLGAQERGYGSDLDLVFVYTNGVGDLLRPLHRALHFLSTPTRSGPMLRVDLRLRPSGSQGPLLVEHERMLDYYEREASGAECLAAMNLRHVAGDQLLGGPVVMAVRQIASERLRDNNIVKELLRIRQKQHSSVAGTPGTKYDPKMESGGMLDIETVARLCAVRIGLMPTTGTFDTLRQVSESRALADFSALEALYRFLWRLCASSSLVVGRPIQELHAGGPAATRLARFLGFTGAAEMWSHVREVLGEGERRCRRLLEDMGYAYAR